MLQHKTLEVLGVKDNAVIQCRIKQADFVTKRAQLTTLWHNFSLLKWEVIGNMMFWMAILVCNKITGRSLPNYCNPNDT